MRAIDTNIVLRLLFHDDAEQGSLADDLIGNEDVLVSTCVLLEASWVMRSVYNVAERDAAVALLAFVRLPHVFTTSPHVEAALDWVGQGMQLDDALIYADAHASSEFVTFDVRLAKLAARFDAEPPVRLLGRSLPLSPRLR